MFKQEKGIWVADVGEAETYQLNNERYNVWATMSGTYMGLSITSLWSIALGSLWHVSEHWVWVWKESFGGWEPHVLSPDCGVVFLLLVFRTWMTWLWALLFPDLWTALGHTLYTTLSNMVSAIPQLSWLHVAHSGTTLPWVSEIHGRSKGELEHTARKSKQEAHPHLPSLQPPSDWRQECQAFMGAS